MSSVGSPAASWLGVERNLILRAGAGTGKTHTLVTLALGLLLGLRRGEPVEPHQLWLLTFSELAAAELRGRLRARLMPLAAGQSLPQAEPELWAAAGGVPGLQARLQPARFAALLDRVSEVRAQTLHGAAMALLREQGGGELTGFTVLEAEVSQELLNQVAQEIVLGAGGGSELSGAELALLEDFGFRGQGGFRQGLVESLALVAEKLSEDGIETLPVAGPIDLDLSGLVAELRRTWWAAEADRRQRDDRLVGLAAAVAALPVEDAEALADHWRLLSPARAKLHNLKGDLPRAARDAFDGLGKRLGQLRAEGHLVPFLTLLTQVRNGFQAAKRERGVLDFADLCTLARARLRDDREARRAAKAQVGALLLDETQDTSRVQVELCLLLAETRSQEAELDPSRRLADQVTLEPGAFCAVGDRKQSIYEFRGANVEVFEELAEAVLRNGGRAEALTLSRRSRPSLVDFVNRLFAQILVGGGPEGAAGFSADDALTALRPVADLGPATLLALRPIPPTEGKRELAEERRQREARAVAVRVAELLRAPPPALQRELPQERLMPGQVALLFRTSAHIELFRAALAEVGVPSVQLGGTGFYARPEISDAGALLAILADPADRSGGGVAGLTVLRSPLGGLSDAAIARLIFDRRARGEGGLSLRWLWDGPLPSALGEADGQRLAELGQLLRDLRQLAEKVGPAELWREAERRLSVGARYASAQSSANLEKLDRLLANWQAAGDGLPAVVRRLRRKLRDSSGEPQAPAVEPSDTGAVRLLTVHAAKGLEFQVVFVVGCGTLPPRTHPAALYARDIGLALKGQGPDDRWAKTASYARVEEVLAAREAQQERRLFYVAATRARDLLFFSGELPLVGGGATWRDWLDREGPGAGLHREEVAGDRPPSLAGPLFAADRQAEPPPSTDLAAALAATAPLPRALPTRLVLAASAAADLTLCPRRYQLRQLWKVPEHPGRQEPPEELPAEDDPRTLGSLAHRTLELVDFAVALRDPEQALETALELAAGPGALRQRKLADVANEVRAVLQSEAWQALARLPAGRVRREVPFMLRLGEPVLPPGVRQPQLALTGAIDLLVLREDRVQVFDFKRGPPRPTASHLAQLRLYALAAQALTEGQLPIEAGLWFLQRGGSGPDPFSVGEASLSTLRETLLAEAREVAGRDGRSSLLPGRLVPRCRALGCGYLERCHGTSLRT